MPGEPHSKIRKINSVNDRLQPATDGYPLALLPIGNKPLLSYQIEYLESTGVTKIIVVIEKRYMNKLDKYFNNYFKPTNESTEIELVALSDEEETGNVLKMLKDRISKDFIVFSGDTLVDIPLD
jgi:translation initiation factor eIF-2B subunit gamma